MPTRKALIIKSEELQTAPTSGWTDLNEISKFIKQIIIPEIGQEKDGSITAETSDLVSGMPSIFAKANLFKNALDYGLDMSSPSNGLQAIYKSHILEWRGFLSCIALEYGHLNIQRIYLKYTDNQPIGETQNVFEAFGGFGNMLFEKEILWSLHEEDSENRGPYVNIIKFHDELIGGTSPESFLFTAASYKLGDFPFTTSRGKFTDPYRKGNALTKEASNTIRAFVSNILENNLGKFSNIIKNHTTTDDLFVNVREQLKQWSREIEEYERAKGWKTNIENLSPPEVNKFDYPYSVLFNYSTELYGLVGVIHTEDPGENGTIKFKPTDLLLPKEAKIIKIRMEYGSETNAAYLADRPLLLLQAKVTNKNGETGRYAYFTLPLTPKALEIFGESLPALLGLADNIHSKLRGTFDQDDYKLSAELELKTIQGSTRKFYMIYDLEYLKNVEEIIAQDILIWPNFINPKWKRYFMYSEIPHNGIEYKVVPFLGAIDQSHRLNTIYKDSAKNVPFFIADRGATSSYEGPQLYEGTEQKNPQVKLIIENNARVQDNKYKYEIYESNYPFKGLKFSYKNADAGFAIISYTKNEPSLINPAKPKCPVFDTSIVIPQKVYLGIDFGSTNTSVAFYDPEARGKAKEFYLTNKRISLLSNDNKDNRERPAMEDEIFFFQNEKIGANALKSILTLHQARRVSTIPGNTSEMVLATEIYGGFPCFEYNLPIRNSDNSKINLLFPRAENVELVYNMKWSDLEVEIRHKTAYLKTLLLHIYAQLFSERYIPTHLKWSYPSAMSSALRGSYQGIFSKLRDINPLIGHNLEITPAGAGDDNYESTGRLNNNEGSGIDKNGTRTITNIITDYPLHNSSDFRLLDNKTALSESSAVANYFLHEHGSKIRSGQYLIIFDIGGSTTDISVVTNNNLGEKQIIKQNSFRWAAQRISQAIPYIKDFNRVLLEYCHLQNIRITGLNDDVTKSVYGEDTASYFYEQIVNRIEPVQFSSFYSRIAANCPNLMSVNLYVTGLIMYYAGQLTHRLTKDLNQNEGNAESILPHIEIVFAGKGARIFDWFKNFNENAATKYYKTMFLQGIGGNDIAKNRIKDFNINLGNSQNAEVKYEVSKGLAIPTDDVYVLNAKQSVEIIGEDGFGVLRPDGKIETLDASNAITPDMMKHIGKYFKSNISDTQNPYPRFQDFYSIFHSTAKSLFGFSLPQRDFLEGIRDMDIENFIKQLPEYGRASNNEDETFDFVAPIFIMEGVQFYENKIIPYLKNILKQ